MLSFVRLARLVLVILTGLAAGVSCGALEQSPQTRAWLSDSN